jgi:hypothetical protein
VCRDVELSWRASTTIGQGKPRMPKLLQQVPVVGLYESGPHLADSPPFSPFRVRFDDRLRICNSPPVCARLCQAFGELVFVRKGIVVWRLEPDVSSSSPRHKRRGGCATSAFRLCTLMTSFWSRP